MPVRYPIRIVVAGVGLGLAFDRLVVNHELGLGFTLFVLLVVGALALTVAWERAAPERLAPLRQNLWVLVPLIFFAVMVAARSNEFITFLNIVAVLILLCVVAIYLLRRPLTAVNLPGYALAPLLAPIMAAWRGAQTGQHAGVTVASAWRGERRSAWTPIARGILLACPVVVIFALLLSSADLMFAEVLHRILPVDILTFVQDLIAHGVVTLAVGFLMLGGLAYTVWRTQTAREPDAVLNDLSVPPVLGLTEAAVVLAAVNVLFAAFVLIQIPYLFGGQLNIDLGRTTYAEYARRGFGELVFTSVLVLGMLLVLGVLARRETPRQRVVFNVLCTITVGLTLVMLVSAFKRLLLYEVAYGFTEMRVYPHVFMIWLGLLLGWFLVTLWLKPGRFAVGLVVACIGFLVTLNVLNVDDFIVRENVRRYTEQGAAAFSSDGPGYRSADERIDPEYLTRLSDDAIPALAQNVARLEGAPRQTITKYLQERYDWYVKEDRTTGAQGYNLARGNARRAVILWHDSPR